MLREAAIHLPILDNDGESLDHVHKWLASTLVARFNGATVVEGNGLWMHRGHLYEEPVKRYLVAFSNSDANRDLLRSIARAAGRRAKQLAMYVKMPYGDVEIIDIEEAAVAA